MSYTKIMLSYLFGVRSPSFSFLKHPNIFIIRKVKTVLDHENMVQVSKVSRQGDKLGTTTFQLPADFESELISFSSCLVYVWRNYYNRRDATLCV